jgi:hypothetical protein
MNQDKHAYVVTVSKVGWTSHGEHYVGEQIAIVHGFGDAMSEKIAWKFASDAVTAWDVDVAVSEAVVGIDGRLTTGRRVLGVKGYSRTFIESVKALFNF